MTEKRTLAQLYDPDRRATDSTTRDLAGRAAIPHPLCGCIYADGIYRCGNCDSCQPMRATVRDALAIQLGWEMA